MIPMFFDQWEEQARQAVEACLECHVSPTAPARLGEVMRYGVLGGGKRLRALLVLAAAQSCQTTLAEPAWSDWPEATVRDWALRAGCAVELIHAYSLIHDDMPCMDNDVLRRGKPTVHVAYGEALALLAGDAMQALAFEVITPEAFLPADALVCARLCALLARASGWEGMAGGQAIDLAHVGCSLTIGQLQDMHRRKTGALIEASVRMGGICAGAEVSVMNSLGQYGQALGVAFQVVDDILDVTQSSATLGKTAGKDQAFDKPTFVSLMGLDAARHYAHDLREQALQALEEAAIPSPTGLRALAFRLVDRQF
jgi:farnesyl diphosphate synthase